MLSRLLVLWWEGFIYYAEGLFIVIFLDSGRPCSHSSIWFLQTWECDSVHNSRSIISLIEHILWPPEGVTRCPPYQLGFYRKETSIWSTSAAFRIGCHAAYGCSWGSWFIKVGSPFNLAHCSISAVKISVAGFYGFDSLKTAFEREVCLHSFELSGLWRRRRGHRRDVNYIMFVASSGYLVEGMHSFEG